MKNVTKHTRAKKGGIITVCPYCDNKGPTYHFAWFSKVCQGCGKTVKKTDWLIDKPTKVIFRKFKNKDIPEVIALFPDLSYARNYMTESYMHTGQHGDCDYQAVIAMTTPAKPGEYKDLYQELETIGYNLLVRQRAKIIYKR
jgi:hypothetical protein